MRKEEKLTEAPISKEDVDSSDLDHDDLSDLSDQITEEELKASVKGKRHMKPESVDQLPLYPPVSQKMKAMNEQIKREHLPFDLCDKKNVRYNAVRPPTKKHLKMLKKKKKQLKEEGELIVVSETPIYPVFSSIQDLDVGEVETVEEYERRRSKYKNNEDDKPLNLRKVNFVKGEVIRSDIRIA